nr:immunoglobulin heavy chain junction region [Mus musculus]
CAGDDGYYRKYFDYW